MFETEGAHRRFVHGETLWAAGATQPYRIATTQPYRIATTQPYRIASQAIAELPNWVAQQFQTGERSIDWYSDQLPTNCETWQQQIRGRYQAIGRYLRPDRLLTVLGRRVRPVALPDMALIDGRTYDLAVLCTGNQETTIEGLEVGSFDEYTIAGGNVVARKHFNLPAFRIGPHARLPFTRQEREDGLADIPENAVSMFRTATKTAALAATLLIPGRAQ